MTPTLDILAVFLVTPRPTRAQQQATRRPRSACTGWRRTPTVVTGRRQCSGAHGLAVPRVRCDRQEEAGAALDPEKYPRSRTGVMLRCGKRPTSASQDQCFRRLSRERSACRCFARPTGLGRWHAVAPCLVRSLGYIALLLPVLDLLRELLISQLLQEFDRHRSCLPVISPSRATR
jgi:hypothetical protein